MEGFLGIYNHVFKYQLWIGSTKAWLELVVLPYSRCPFVKARCTDTDQSHCLFKIKKKFKNSVMNNKLHEKSIMEKTVCWFPTNLLTASAVWPLYLWIHYSVLWACLLIRRSAGPELAVNFVWTNTINKGLNIDWEGLKQTMQSFQIFIFVPIDTMLECRSEVGSKVCGREKKSLIGLHSDAGI